MLICDFSLVYFEREHHNIFGYGVLQNDIKKNSNLLIIRLYNKFYTPSKHWYGVLLNAIKISI